MDIEKICASLRVLPTTEELLTAEKALYALQAENERLRNELERQRRSADNMRHLYENAERAYIKTEAELEQVKLERDKLESFLGELEGAVYTGQYFHLRPMIEKWRGPEED